MGDEFHDQGVLGTPLGSEPQQDNSAAPPFDPGDSRAAPLETPGSDGALERARQRVMAGEPVG